MELKINYEYTYFIYPYAIKSKNYKKYVNNLIRNRKFSLKFFDTFKDIDICVWSGYTYETLIERNDNRIFEIFEIADVGETPEKVTEDMDEYARHLGNFQVGEWVYKCSLNKNVKEGTYSANVVIESIAPMTFITN